MHMLPPPNTWTRKELSTCIYINRANRFRLLSNIFATASYLGNGLLWYLLMLGLLIAEGTDAVPTVVLMGAVGIIATAIYKLLKHQTMRPRPCSVSSQLFRTVEPLDVFSFPSGHTLHAVAFTILSCANYPSLAWYLVPFTLLVAGSRLVLGLHYPSDVLAGALIGATCSSLALVSTHSLGLL